MPKDDETVRAQVLIVDDEPEHAQTMADALRKPGHVCTVVHSAAAAAEELQGGMYDVIVTDLVMERPDAGLAVLAQAKASQPQAETILVTAHGDVPTAKAALQGGAYDFIEKPLDLVVFRNLVQRAAQAVALRQQERLGVVQAAAGGWKLQVEIQGFDSTLPVRQRHRRLAHLARAHQGHGGEAPQQPTQSEVRDSIEHCCKSTILWTICNDKQASLRA